MRRLISLLTLLFLSDISTAHEVRLSTQHLKLNRQGKSGWQQDIFAKAQFSSNWHAGINGTYLERFDIYERRLGSMVVYSPHELLTIEASYQRGLDEVELLPRDQYQLSLYHALGTGTSPFLIFQNSLYTVTHLQSMRLGVELEKISGLILIPQVLLGQASFTNQSEHKNIYSLGLRAVYYKESNYSFILYGYRGTEAAQGAFGRSSQTINTLTGGLGAGLDVMEALKTELLFDYTDFDEINNQFLTTTFNLTWKF